MPTSTAPVLVTGVTGRQGGATARALLAAGVPVRALVRNPDSEPARAIQAAGAELVTGDLLDRGSLDRAAEGARAVFSVQMAPFTGTGFDFDAEVRMGVNLIEAARAAGVPQFVHTSVSGAGRQEEIPGWNEGRWSALEPPLTAKTAIQDRLRTAGFPRWTLLKPSFFMINFLPSMRFLFPRGIEGGLASLIKPDTRVPLIDTEDVGVAAAAAITDPDRFHEVELELAGDFLSMKEIAAVLSRALGVPLEAPDMTLEQAKAAGMPDMGIAHAYMNVRTQPARPEFARDLGLPVTSFQEWAERNLSPTA
ncbi:NmrA/HSCARG family protein [Microbispora sp. SCL1-1]|jgi:uncharacterized protein YbjT (DUF2867 family)|uniref:NmrA/HSCARG family protein n=1 Tax=Microbispora hainanensis TaxID=568844 RepID=A0ABZ1SUL5_9ACTN|nr:MULTISPECIES: NmrA/HSCARG family protein [Microbispora]NJP25330.1 NmrA/HSCARG family protein [Microbispora sp. CL1-1]TQS13776.1 NmrA/HSCARG family protein [Microbispora sp. SCL1-1]